MKTKIRAILAVIWEDIIKPLFFYTLCLVIIIGIPFVLSKFLTGVLNILFHNQGVTILGAILLVVALVVFIFYIILAIVGYVNTTIIPEYKKRLKELNKEDKKY